MQILFLYIEIFITVTTSTGCFVKIHIFLLFWWQISINTYELYTRVVMYKQNCIYGNLLKLDFYLYKFYKFYNWYWSSLIITRSFSDDIYFLCIFCFLLVLFLCVIIAISYLLAKQSGYYSYDLFFCKFTYCYDWCNYKIIRVI